MQHITDFHNGLQDINNKVIAFIDDPLERITQDPLRIIRAYRFQLSLQFTFEQKTEAALRSLHTLIKKVSASRLQTEINKVTDKNVQRKLLQVIHKNT